MTTFTIKWNGGDPILLAEGMLVDKGDRDDTTWLSTSVTEWRERANDLGRVRDLMARSLASDLMARSLASDPDDSSG